MPNWIKVPNIGKVTIERLARININSYDDLLKLGSKEAYKRLYEVEGDTCLDTLYGLEGAVEGVRWHDLNEKKRKELKEYFDYVNGKDK